MLPAPLLGGKLDAMSLDPDDETGRDWAHRVSTLASPRDAMHQRFAESSFVVSLSMLLGVTL